MHAATGEAADELTLDLTAAYEAEGLKSLIRTLVWHKEELPHLELIDNYSYAGVPDSWTERFITWRLPEVLSSGAVLLPGQESGGVKVTYDPAAVELQMNEHVYRDHFGQEQVWYSLDFQAVRPGSEGSYAFTFQFI
ncbi:hypothetical protein D3C76_1194800 [compost metagenome]